jgi:hypothetical protein
MATCVTVDDTLLRMRFDALACEVAMNTVSLMDHGTNGAGEERKPSEDR